MSAQAGIWNFDGEPVDSRLIAEFHKSLRQLGPDAETCWQSGPVALLYRPFHTTAESRRERQPYVSQRNFVVTWDGRLDNRDELALEFRNYLQSDPTDVALVAAAFDHWETGCFRRLVGDWAVTIWRPEERELIFACDYMAVRHIFYHVKRERIWWSTDLAQLVLLSHDQFHIDDEYIAGYFAHDPDSHLTPYREIRQVPAGCWVSVRSGNARCERYWRFSPKSRIRYRTDSEYEEHFRHVFRQSVRRRLRCDSPVLAELSGGLDSSSIVCMADDILAKEGAQTPRLDTLSYYDNTESHGDDWIYFQKVEAYRGRTGHHIDASKLGTAPASLEPDDFQVLPGCLNSSRDLEAERAAVVRGGDYRVVFSGIGGDEFLGGVPNPNAQLADLIMQCKLVKLSQQLMAWSLVKRRPWTHLLWGAVIDLFPPPIAAHFSKLAKVEPWISTSFAERTRLAERLIDVDEHFGLWLPTRRSNIGTVLLMANKLAKMPSSDLQLEEVRYPYLDQDLIEFMLAIPATQVLRPGERRSLMRRSLAGLVPQEILSRKTKQFGARTPIVGMGKNLDEIERAFRLALSADLGYVNPDIFLERLKAARTGKDIHLARTIRTISLELWLRDLASRQLIAGLPIPESSLSIPLEAIA